MSKGVFVTATDTGVGKTYISCLIAKELKKYFKVGVFKPFLTGSLSDAKKLKASSGSALALDVINPIFLRNPLAPYPASKIEKKKLDFALVYRTFESIKNSHEYIIVEGAGGLYVPITKNFFMIDLIKKLKLPVLLVARPGLGTINHTLLSLKALKEKKVRVLAVVLNSYTGKDIAEKTNPDIIRQLIKLPLFVVRKNQGKLPGRLLKLLMKDNS